MQSIIRPREFLSELLGETGCKNIITCIFRTSGRTVFEHQDFYEDYLGRSFLSHPDYPCCDHYQKEHHELLTTHRHLHHGDNCKKRRT